VKIRKTILKSKNALDWTEGYYLSAFSSVQLDILILGANDHVPRSSRAYIGVTPPTYYFMLVYRFETDHQKRNQSGSEF
jgi:hypothetical protein